MHFEAEMAWIFLLSLFGNLKLSQRLASLLAWPQKGKVPMEDMLKRRSFNCPSWCCMCFEEEEYVGHLLVSY